MTIVEEALSMGIKISDLARDTGISRNKLYKDKKSEGAKFSVLELKKIRAYIDEHKNLRGDYNSKQTEVSNVINDPSIEYKSGNLYNIHNLVKAVEALRDRVKALEDGK